MKERASESSTIGKKRERIERERQVVPSARERWGESETCASGSAVWSVRDVRRGAQLTLAVALFHSPDLPLSHPPPSAPRHVIDTIRQILM